MGYHFEDFTMNNYALIMRKLQSRYKFIPFRYNFMMDVNIVLCRHDVDFSLKRALRFAEIEYDIGVYTTYFVLFHSDFYNPLEIEECRILRKIKGMGHSIGLHFDHEFYMCFQNKENDGLFLEKMELERNILEQLIEDKVETVSFHNPDLSGAINITDRYVGINNDLLNAYSTDIMENFEYCSDSNGYWRFKRLEDVIDEKPSRLYILLHPGNWSNGDPISPYERVSSCAYDRAELAMSNYCELLKKAGRENVGYING